MLPTALIMEVRRLLDRRELSYREIAKRLGVSRGLITAMAKGRRGDYGRDAGKETTTSSPKRELGPATRCPACGGLVYLPCRLCAARAINERRLAIIRFRQDRPPSTRRAA